MQAGALSVSQPPTPTGRATAGDEVMLRPFRPESESFISDAKGTLREWLKALKISKPENADSQRTWIVKLQVLPIGEEMVVVPDCGRSITSCSTASDVTSASR